MTPRICICCGEPMSDRGNALSRNPNICACCSSLADGMEEPGSSQTSTVDPEGPALSGTEAPQANATREGEAEAPNRLLSGSRP